MKNTLMLLLLVSIFLMACEDDKVRDTSDTIHGDIAKTVYTRKDIYSLAATDSIVIGYKTAIQAMQALPATDQRSWTYQAAIHGTRTRPVDTAWNSCQHGSFFFLSWHRMYLYYFERIVRKYSGVSNWALPFWNYSNGNARALPTVFRNPSNSTNPLFISQRRASINTGSPLTTSTVSIECLNVIPFTGTIASIESFGGESIPAPQQFWSGGTGALENVPHNVVHNAIGGLMRDPRTAAQDPIFWLHHCNIDRLWESWVALGNGRANPADMTNPADSIWLTTKFQFYDEDAQLVELTGQEIINTVSQLNYKYEYLSPAPTPNPPPNRDKTRETATMLQTPAPQQVLAETPDNKETVLTNAPLTVLLPITDNKQDLMVKSLNAQPDGQDDKDAYLSVEGLSFDSLPDQSYGIFLNVPEGETPDFNSVHYVNIITFFGLMHHAGNGHAINLLYPLEQTIKRLQEAGIDVSTLSVTFFPTTGVEPPPGAQPKSFSDEAPLGNPKIKKLKIILL